METGLLRDALTLIAGVATGIMSGTFGVGGAVISTPAIRALVAFSLVIAVATGCIAPCTKPAWRHSQNQFRVTMV